MLLREGRRGGGPAAPPSRSAPRPAPRGGKPGRQRRQKGANMASSRRRRACTSARPGPRSARPRRGRGPCGGGKWRSARGGGRAGCRHSRPAPGAASPEVSSAPSWLEFSSFLLTLAAGADMLVAAERGGREGRGGCNGAARGRGGGPGTDSSCCCCCCRRRSGPSAAGALPPPPRGPAGYRGGSGASHSPRAPSPRAATAASSSAAGEGRARGAHARPPLPGRATAAAPRVRTEPPAPGALRRGPCHAQAHCAPRTHTRRGGPACAAAGWPRPATAPRRALIGRGALGGRGRGAETQRTARAGGRGRARGVCRSGGRACARCTCPRALAVAARARPRELPPHPPRPLTAPGGTDPSVRPGWGPFPPRAGGHGGAGMDFGTTDPQTVLGKVLSRCLRRSLGSSFSASLPGGRSRFPPAVLWGCGIHVSLCCLPYLGHGTRQSYNRQGWKRPLRASCPMCTQYCHCNPQTIKAHHQVPGPDTS